MHPPGLEPSMVTALAPPSAAAASPLKAKVFQRGRSSRDFPVALGISVVLHAVIFATVSFHFRIQPIVPAAPLLTFRFDDAMQAYDIEAVKVGFGEPEPEPLPARPPSITRIPPPPVLQAPLISGAGAAAAGAGTGKAGAPATSGAVRGSAAERLSRGYGDPQLLAPVDRLPPEEVTESEWLRMRLANRLELYNDSMSAEAAAKLRATDWTVKDKNGGRWGVSPGKIHLGNRTLPLPFGFSPPPGRRDEIAGRVRSWEESQAQASRAEAAETFEQRVKAIRARQEAARDSARKRAGGG